MEDVSEQEVKELREELIRLRITCKGSDAKMHSQQEHSKLLIVTLSSQSDKYPTLLNRTS